MENEIQTAPGKNPTERALEVTQSPGILTNSESMQPVMKVARALCGSTLVPTEYRGEKGLGNTLIALEIAQRTQTSPIVVMQNLYVIHGRPSWSSQFIIACLNACGRFSTLRFNLSGEGDNRACIAYATELETGERLEGPAVSIGMAKNEGWFNKSGSKWKSMPELMLRYRAATFFGRLYAPDILMGMQSVEELRDVHSASQSATQSKADAVMAEVSNDG